MYKGELKIFFANNRGFRTLKGKLRNLRNFTIFSKSLLNSSLILIKIKSVLIKTRSVLAKIKSMLIKIRSVLAKIKSVLIKTKSVLVKIKPELIKKRSVLIKIRPFEALFSIPLTIGLFPSDVRWIQKTYLF